MKSIFYNGKVYTGSDTSFAEAFAVENGRFLAVGQSAALLAEASEGDLLIDLAGAFVAPGFNDSHMHLLNFGQALSMADLSVHTESLADMIAYVKDYLAAHPVREGQWLKGRGWNQDYFTDVSRMPSRDDLDEISTTIPIMLTRACGHVCVVNSKVLEICGITDATPSPAGGEVGKEHGRLDGRFYDNGIGLINPFLPLPDLLEIKSLMRLAVKALNAYGITSVQSDDYGVFKVPVDMIHQAYRELAQSGELTLRVYEQNNFGSLEGLQAFIDAGHRTGKGDHLFKIGPLKMLGDGSLGGRTAFLSRPYADDPATSGFPLYSREKMNAMIRLAHENGMQVAVHAIGDACLDMVLDAVEEALTESPRDDHRHGIVHCQISREDQLERMARLKMHIYAQSIFLDYDNHIVTSRVGEALAASSYNWKTLMQKGLTVSNGSDAPVERPDVMKGIQCAVTRTSLDGTGPYLPGEAFSVKEALDSFTISGAMASFEENEKGRIAPDYLADFVVLGRDPFSVPPAELHQIPILATYVGGRKVFSA